MYPSGHCDCTTISLYFELILNVTFINFKLFVNSLSNISSFSANFIKVKWPINFTKLLLCLQVRKFNAIKTKLSFILNISRIFFFSFLSNIWTMTDKWQFIALWLSKNLLTKFLNWSDYNMTWIAMLDNVKVMIDECGNQTTSHLLINFYGIFYLISQ